MWDTELNARGQSRGMQGVLVSSCWTGALSLGPSGLVGCSKDTNQLGQPDTESQGLCTGVLRTRAEKVTRAL